MGSDLIIVVFAVVVIGGMGSILGAILTGFALGIVEGLTKVFYPEASNTVIFVIMAIVLLMRPAGLFGRSASDGTRARACVADARPRQRLQPRRCLRGDDRAVRDRPVRRLSGLFDEGVVLRAVRLRLQSSDRLCRPWPRSVMRCSSAGRAMSTRLCGEGLGLAARARDHRRHRGRGRARLRRRRARYSPAGHLLRHDHAGARRK